MAHSVARVTILFFQFSRNQYECEIDPVQATRRKLKGQTQ